MDFVHEPIPPPIPSPIPPPIPVVPMMLQPDTAATPLSFYTPAMTSDKQEDRGAGGSVDAEKPEDVGQLNHRASIVEDQTSSVATVMSPETLGSVSTALSSMSAETTTRWFGVHKKLPPTTRIPPARRRRT